MDETIGGQKFLEIPGRAEQKYTLPTLYVSRTIPLKGLSEIQDIVDNEELIIADLDLPISGQLPEKSRTELLFEKIREEYISLVRAWAWGDCLALWMHQCAISFRSTTQLQNIIPCTHGKRVSFPSLELIPFAQLLERKQLPRFSRFPESTGDELQLSIGARLIFRQLPKVSYLTGDTILYLGPTLYNTAYADWCSKNPLRGYLLPSERFEFAIELVD